MMCPISWIMPPVVTHLIVVLPLERSDLNLTTSADSIPKHLDHHLFNSTGEIWHPNPADECGAIPPFEQAIMGLKDAPQVIQHTLSNSAAATAAMVAVDSQLRTLLAVTSITT